MRRRFFHCWTRSVMPRWLAPFFAALAVAIGLLNIFLPNGPRDSHSASVGLALVGVVVAAWGAETLGLRWSRALFVVAVDAPVIGLMSLGSWSLAPVFLLVLVIWVAYFERRWQSILVL